MKNVFQSPRFVFAFVWFVTAALFLWGWSRPFSAARQRALEITRSNQQAPGPPVVPLEARGLFAKIREPGAILTVVNVWATWCEPCRREMPGLVGLRKIEGVRVLLVSGDDPAEEIAIKKFLAEQKVDFESYRVGGHVGAFMKELNPSWSGALPATFLYRTDGRLHSFFLGEIPADTLRAKVVGALNDARETP